MPRLHRIIFDNTLAQRDAVELVKTSEGRVDLVTGLNPLETLRAFVYASRHLEVMRHRRRWFHRMADPYLALWWVPAGTIPTVAEARERLELLTRDGPGPQAFPFREPFPAPAGAAR